MYTVAALVYPDALATSLTLPMEILGAAGQMARGGDRRAPHVEFLLAGDTIGAITLASGLTLHTTARWDKLPALDLLLLPAVWRNPRATLEACRDWLPTLAGIAAAGTRICSVGTASRLLAEAGLLRGRPATTHWNDFERFRKRYPDVDLKTRHLITQSGNIFCVGSVNSIADFCVHVVEDWYGSRIARAVEHQFSPEIRQPFRSAAWQDQPRTSHHDETVLEAQLWLQEHVRRPVAINRLPTELGISMRTLNRRFRQATGMSPLTYLNSLRSNNARELLRRSNLSISEIAWQLGLQDVSYFARLFRRFNGMTPGAYRAAVRGKLFAPQVGDAPGDDSRHPD